MSQKRLLEERIEQLERQLAAMTKEVHDLKRCIEEWHHAVAEETP